MKDKKILIVNISLIIVFLGGIIYFTVLNMSYIKEYSESPEKLRDLLVGYGWKSAFVFMLMQMFQVVVAFIPGEFVQIAGGYVYGPFVGTVYSLIGILAGYCIAFTLARLLGYRLVRYFVSEQKLEKLNHLINSKKIELILFTLFLIPGLPKDMFVYVAGLTPVKPVRFFIIVFFARLPAMLVASVIGNSLQQKDYQNVIIISVIAVILFTAGLLFKEKIFEILGINKKE